MKNALVAAKRPTIRAARHFVLLFLLGLALPGIGQESIIKENMEHYSQLYKRGWLTPFSIEFQTGATYYTGDITGGVAIAAQNYLLNPAYALALSYRLTDYISLRAQASYFRLRATANQPIWDSASFRSNNLSGTVMLVHDFFSKRATEAFEVRLNPYAGFGLGVLRFEPRDPKTGERQRPGRELLGLKPYNNLSLVIPLCFGVQYTLFENIWVGAEVNYNFTMTDYLDNAAPPAGSAKDGYYLFGLRAGIQLYGFYNYRNYLRSK